MSIIYIAKKIEEKLTKIEVTRLYEIINMYKKGRGKIRYDCIVSITSGQITSIDFAIPYSKIDKIYSSIDELEKDLGKGIYTDSTKVSKDKLLIEKIEANKTIISKIELTKQKRAEFTYIIATISFKEKLQKGTHVFSFSVEIPNVSVKLSGSWLYETVWTLDITLYGPVSPRSHVFLDLQTIEGIIPIKHGYLEVHLPLNAHCLKYFPPLLEEYCDGRRLKMTWVVGRLEPWYERRIHLVYMSPPGKTMLFMLFAMISIMLALLSILLMFSK